MYTLGEVIGIIFVIIIGVIVLVVPILGLVMLAEIPERNLFNEKYGTNYTAVQWLFAENMITDYIHKGQQKRLNVAIEEVPVAE